MLFKYSNNFSLKAKSEFCINETNENSFEIRKLELSEIKTS